VTADPSFADEQQIAALIDHTLLKPEATASDILDICKQALEHNFASVCVNPYWVPLVHSQLRGSKVRTCSVIGFPLGANQTITKLEEARLATGQGASEIDMVINIGALRSGHSEVVADEIGQLAEAAHAAGAILKVILETGLLSAEQKSLACALSKQAAADFVKTSTGFSTGGATEADVKLMRSIVGPDLGVKASGGVRSLDALTRMVRAGANRIGTSSGVQIVAEFQSSLTGSSAIPSRARDGGTY
jgi:deoxyribose-phosphate aldolase